MATQYATRENLEQLALAAAAFSGVSDDDVDAALIAASSEADSYLASRYGDSLPLATWPLSLRQNICKLAAWNLMCAIGFQPGDNSHVAIQINYDAAVKWFTGVSMGRISLAIADTSPRHGYSPYVSSDDDRGF
jgi:phage gp36-like protein